MTNEKSRIFWSVNVTTMASSMPKPLMAFPRRAVRADESIFKPRMKHTEATR